MQALRVAEGFTPEHVGKKLAHTWNIDGLTLQLTAATSYDRE